MDNIDHYCHRVAACLHRGSALLVGVGGSGKQSLAKFAAFVSDCDLRTVSMAAGYNLARFREEVKHVMKVSMPCSHTFAFCFVHRTLRFWVLVSSSMYMFSHRAV